jgi:hypothetical protein
MTASVIAQLSSAISKFLTAACGALQCFSPATKARQPHRYMCVGGGVRRQRERERAREGERKKEREIKTEREKEQIKKKRYNNGL